MTVRRRGSWIILGALTGVLIARAAAPARSEGSSNLPAVSARLAQATRLIEVEKPQVGQSKGTAFVVCPEGMVVTAAHLISGADRILVKRSMEDAGVAARVIVEDRGWDIAVLETDGPAPGEDGCLSLAASSVLPAGSDVAYSGYAFGTDLGFMSLYSTYRGIISSVLEQENEGVPGHLYNLGSLVITGLSGGPLYLPESGEVVGIVVRQYGPKGMGMGFGGAVAMDALGAVLKGAREARRRPGTLHP